MVLERVGLEEQPFSSAALVIDRDLKDKATGQNVALVVYSPGGNILVLFKDGYDTLQVMAAGEMFVGEMLAASRFKVFRAEVVKK